MIGYFWLVHQTVVCVSWIFGEAVLSPLTCMVVTASPLSPVSYGTELGRMVTRKMAMLHVNILSKVQVKYTDIAVHSITCHTAKATHMPYKSTQCYLPHDRGGIPAFTPAEAGTRLSDRG